jgi:rhodanese-related sulfurtransferase
MVMQEEEDNLDKVLKESDNQELSITPAVTPAVTQKPDDETKPTPITPSPTVTITPTPEPTLKPEPTMKPKPTNMPSKDETSEDKSNEDKEYSFTIERGMSSYEVAKMLHEIGLVEDLVGFDKYLMEEGKSKIIRVGAYSIKNGASFDEIAEIITEE